MTFFSLTSEHICFLFLYLDGNAQALPGPVTHVKEFRPPQEFIKLWYNSNKERCKRAAEMLDLVPDAIVKLFEKYNIEQEIMFAFTVGMDCSSLAKLAQTLDPNASRDANVAVLKAVVKRALQCGAPWPTDLLLRKGKLQALLAVFADVQAEANKQTKVDAARAVKDAEQSSDDSDSSDDEGYKSREGTVSKGRELWLKHTEQKIFPEHYCCKRDFGRLEKMMEKGKFEVVSIKKIFSTCLIFAHTSHMYKSSLIIVELLVLFIIFCVLLFVL